MKKIFYIGFTAAFIICSIATGWFCYGYFKVQQSDESVMDKLNWVIELTDKYGYISYDERGFIGTKDMDEVLIKEVKVESGAFDESDYDTEDIGQGNTTYYVVNYKGKEIYRAPKDADVMQVKDNLFEIRDSKGIYIVDVNTGNKVGELDDCWSAEDAGNGCYKATSDYNMDGFDTYKLLNSQFQPINKYIYTRIGDFNEGYLSYGKYVSGDYDNMPEDTSERIQGYMDENFNVAAEFKNSIYANDFNEGKAVIYFKDHVICVDKNWNELYSISLKTDIDVKKLNEDARLDVISLSTYENGKSIIYDGDKIGIVDERGNWIVNPIYDELLPSSNNSFQATKDKKSGLIGDNGEIIIEPVFTDITIVGDYAVVQKGIKYGVIKIDWGDKDVK